MINEIINKAFKQMGYEIKKINIEERGSNPSQNIMKDVFYNHNYTVDIYHFADKECPATESFKKKICSGEYVLKEFPCPICNSSLFTLVATSKEGFEWGVCKCCGLLQLHKRLQVEDLNRFYTSGEYQAICMGNIEDQYHFNLEYKVMSLYFIDILRCLGIPPKDINIIEIGCGSGGILLGLKEWGVNSVVGFDIDEKRIDFGKKYLPELKVDDALSMEIDINQYGNVLLLSNVLEHLHEPQSFLSKISSKISDTCVKIIIDVPNLEGCSEYSKKTFLDFLNISHLWYFNSISLERLLNNSGFSIDYIFNRGSAFSIVCRKNTVQKTNTNNSYWGSISAINYANYVNTPLNATERALVVMHKLKKS